MLTLFLIRHAKSSWEDPGLSDKDRPLNKRGKKDAPLMGSILRDKNESASLIISSPAKRAYDTAKIIAEETGYKAGKIEKDDKLYMADINDFISVIKKAHNSYTCIMLFSHNYGITDFANFIGDLKIENIPTCGIVKIKFKTDNWKNVTDLKGKTEFFIFPKMFKN